MVCLAPADAPPRSLLVVDDDAGMLDTLVDILEAKGYEVTAAGSGEAGIQHVQARAFHLALIDIQMPGLDGVETLEAVRAIAPALPVVLMTAYMRHDLVGRAQRALTILPKPLNMTDMLALIEATVGRPAIS